MCFEPPISSDLFHDKNRYFFSFFFIHSTYNKVITTYIKYNTTQLVLKKSKRYFWIHTARVSGGMLTILRNFFPTYLPIQYIIFYEQIQI